tara:strand:+ start:479 stop:1114 length:636 start_codon:yes stop_codon:yes gene_type:complete
MKKKVAIVDYGLGNILSAKQSFLQVSKKNNINANVEITDKPDVVADATHIVLPGQGAFSSCMDGLSGVSGMIDQLSRSVIDKKKPFLGICVGMQLLADTSYENGEHKGLGWIKGSIKKLPSSDLKLPHMGWNEVKVTDQKNSLEQKNTIIDYYFVHNYYFLCSEEKNVVGVTNYGINFTSFISKENIYGVQFHPEKSSTQGLNLLKNFLNL